MKVKISLVNSKNEPFMGIGIVWLCQKIEKFKSIRLAAKDMNMSYMKAHKILKNLEKNLGKKIVIRYRGGYNRGGAELTEFGKKFIKEYERYTKKVQDFAAKNFKSFLEKLT